MKKRIVILLLTLSLVLSTVPAAFAEETTAPVETTEATTPPRAEDQCGEDLFWKLEGGTLTISGTGAMDDYVGGAPWAEHKNEIEKLVLSGVTYIGAESFRDYDKLTEIEFGYHIREIGTRAFYGCDGLTSISLPMSFKIFGEESLRACANLEEIHCDGGFPSFRLNCMWESYVTIYYPAERPWPVSLIQELEEAFHGRIEFIASDGTDPYVPEETTEPTEQTVPPTTAAPTEAPTTAPVEETTEATMPVVETTTAVTEAAPLPTEETEPETVPETTAPAEDTQEEEANALSAMKVVMIGIAAAVVLTVILALLLIFRRAGRKGKFEY